MEPTRQLLLDCPADTLSSTAILERARYALRGTTRLTIEGLNVAKLVEARRDSSLLAALHAASIVHLDGAGVALAARWLRRGFPPRIAGIDLMDPLLALAAAEGASVFLLGAQEDVVTRAAAAMQQRHPGLVIAGTQHGYFTESEAADVARAIAASAAGLLLVGISSPKKEQFLHRYGSACGVAVAMGVGGAFDVVAGHLRRAPRWMQRNGLEWLFRMLQEPRRLTGRYLRTNLIFAGLLLREWWRQKMAEAPLSFAWDAFLPMLRDDTASCRHALFFLHRNSLLGGRVRAVVAALRDLRWLLYPPRHTPLQPSTNTVAIATLPGAAGLGTIAQAAAACPGTPLPIIAHPRMKGMPYYPTPVTIRDAVRAVGAAWRSLQQPNGALRRTIVASCQFRAALWQASWQNFLRHHPRIETFLLHNDFDMMSRTLTDIAAQKRQVVCVQHGVPTEEFFPTSAPIQLVWGEASQTAYHSLSPHATIHMDALGMASTPPSDAMPPLALHLVSQTHTRAYGLDLSPYFAGLAHALATALPPDKLRILLHPSERLPRAYYGLDPRYLEQAPHPSLQSASPRALIVGYASTALLDAARAGHYVATMAWPVHASHTAHRLCQPPMQYADAADLLADLHRLQTDAVTRTVWQQQQVDWLGNHFTDSGELARYVA